MLERAFAGMAGAILVDPSLVPLVRPHVAGCPDREVERILEVVLELYEDCDAVIDPQSVMTALGDHTARRRVVPLFEHAGAAESPRILLEGELKFLREREAERRRTDLYRRIAELEESLRTGAPSHDVQAAEQELERLLREVSELVRQQSYDSASASA